MDRNFALLGLREDATKEQVKEAYGRRLAKYKSADYADDPEYVKRKIAELNEAYTKAYSRATSLRRAPPVPGSGAGTAPVIPRMPSPPGRPRWTGALCAGA